jgi:hypothetical protein
MSPFEEEMLMKALDILRYENESRQALRITIETLHAGLPVKDRVSEQLLIEAKPASKLVH